MNLWVKLTATALITAAISLPVFAQTDEEKGLEIAKAADAYDEGFVDFVADMVMTLRNRKGQESVRQIRIHTLEVPNQGDKSMSIFDDPADVKGTAMLTYSHGLEPDDQWLYLPALKRVKRISSRNKSGPFMGSEFAFEDLGSQEIEKYSYKFLREEACGDWQCNVIERTPQYKHSGYTSQTVWIDKDKFRITKVDFFDRKKKLLKTLDFSDYNEYVGHYWRPGKMDMQNHQTGKSTTLKWGNYKFRTGLSAKDFNKNKLKSLR